jgi:hypothetical protein
MAKTHADKARFVTLYIREAHPTDEWQMDSNETEGVCYPQPKTLADRLAIANDFVKRNAYALPMLVDKIDNPADELYAGWPERFYIVDEHGLIVYKGKTGPFGFEPDEVDAFLAARP